MSTISDGRARPRAWPARATSVAIVVLLAASAPGALAGAAPGVPDEALPLHAVGRDGAVATPSLVEMHYNPLSGNLYAAVPVGPSLPVGGTFAYTLGLTYNSLHAVKAAADSADLGLGWRLALSRLRPPDKTSAFWIVETPDGGVHPFRENPGSGAMATVDGSHLRLIGAGDARTVQFPDGTTEEFAAADGWWLGRRSDPFGNELRVTQVSATRWELSDSVGRHHTVGLVETAGGRRLVAFIDSSGFAGRPIRTSFEYAQLPPPPCTTDRKDVASEPVLSRLTYPDGRSLSFAYHQDDCLAWGRLRTLGGEAGGTVELTYEAYPLGARVGLAALVEREGTTRASLTQTFQQTVSPAGDELVTETVSANGRHDRYYHRVDRDDPSRTVAPTSASLGDGSGVRFLSQRTLSCPAGAACVPVRSTYLELEPVDPVDALPVVAEVRSTRLVFDDDVVGGVAHWRQVDNLDRDALGDPGRVVESSSFASGGTAVTQMIRAARGDGDRWVHRPPARVTLGDATSQSTTDYCVDARGTILRSRRWQMPAAGPGPHDVLMAYTYDDGGNLRTTRWYGGDRQTLAVSADLCAVVLPPAAEYELRRDVAFGVESRTAWVAPGGGAEVARLRVRDIDLYTGLPRLEQTSANGGTSFDYDARGRRVRETRADGSTVTTTYAPTRIRTVTAAGGRTLADEIRDYDGLGRLTVSAELLPEGRWSRRVSTYDADGNLGSITDAGAEGEARDVTTYADHDIFGRAGRMTYAGMTTLTWRVGQRLERTWRLVGAFRDSSPAGVALLPEIVENEDDARGRRVRTTRLGSDAVGLPTQTSTTFVFNVTGDLLQSLDDGVLAQWKLFDGRGFNTIALLAAGRRGPVQSLTTTVAALDSQGLPLEWVDPRIRRWARTYDGAGRVVAEREGDGARRLTKEYTYDSAFVADPAARARRHNRFESNPPFGDSDVIVETERRALLVGSRLEETHDTRVLAAGRVERDFRHVETYGPGGFLESMTYPTCTTCTSPVCHTAACQAVVPPPDRRVSYERDLGRLTAVTGAHAGTADVWLTGVRYASSGTLAYARHGNGVEDWYDEEPGRARLARIRVERYAYGQRFDSGARTYDGSGRVVRVGDRFHVPPFGTRTPILPTALAAQSWTARCEAEDEQLMSFPAQTTPLGDGCEPRGGLVRLLDAGDAIVFLLSPADPDGTGPILWTLRAGDGTVLREVTADLIGQWRRVEDDVRQGGRLVARSRLVRGETTETTTIWHPGGPPSNPYGWAMFSAESDDDELVDKDAPEAMASLNDPADVASSPPPLQPTAFDWLVGNGCDLATRSLPQCRPGTDESEECNAICNDCCVANDNPVVGRFTLYTCKALVGLITGNPGKAAENVGMEIVKDLTVALVRNTAGDTAAEAVGALFDAAVGAYELREAGDLLEDLRKMARYRDGAIVHLSELAARLGPDTESLVQFWLSYLTTFENLMGARALQVFSKVLGAVEGIGNVCGHVIDDTSVGAAVQDYFRTACFNGCQSKYPAEGELGHHPPRGGRRHRDGDDPPLPWFWDQPDQPDGPGGGRRRRGGGDDECEVYHTGYTYLWKRGQWELAFTDTLVCNGEPIPAFDPVPTIDPSAPPDAPPPPPAPPPPSDQRADPGPHPRPTEPDPTEIPLGHCPGPEHIHGAGDTLGPGGCPPPDYTGGAGGRSDDGPEPGGDASRCFAAGGGPQCLLLRF